MIGVCKHCIFYAPKHEFGSERKHGDCRGHMPKAYMVAGDSELGLQAAHVWTGWPPVEETDFCGEWKERPLATSNERILATIPRLAAAAADGESR